MKRSIKSIAIITILAMIITCIPTMSFATTAPAKTTGVTVSQGTTSTKTIIKWKKASSTAVKGYQIQRKVSGGSYKTIKTITSRSTVKYTTGTQTVGKTYYYRVRAYKKTSSGKKVYGAWSSAKSLKITSTKLSITTASYYKSFNNSSGFNVVYKIKTGKNCANAKMDLLASLSRLVDEDKMYFTFASVTYNSGSSYPSTWKTADSMEFTVKPATLYWVKVTYPKEIAAIELSLSDEDYFRQITYDEFIDGIDFKNEGFTGLGLTYKTKDYSLDCLPGSYELSVIED